MNSLKLKEIQYAVPYFGVIAILLVAGCGKEPVVEQDEKPPKGEEVVELAKTVVNLTAEEVVAAFQTSAESLGLRDESDPATGVYLYFDEATELLYRLSVHGSDPSLFPEAGNLTKRTNEEGSLVIESTIHVDELIWVEAVSVLSGTPGDRVAETEKRIIQIQNAFAKALQEPRIP